MIVQRSTVAILFLFLAIIPSIKNVRYLYNSALILVQLFV